MSKKKSILLQTLLTISLILSSLEYTPIGDKFNGLPFLVASLIGICITILYVDRYKQREDKN